MLSLRSCAVNIVRSWDGKRVVHHVHVGMKLFGPLLSRHFKLLDARVVDVSLEIFQLQIQILFEDAILQLSFWPRRITRCSEKVGNALGVKGYGCSDEIQMGSPM